MGRNSDVKQSEDMPLSVSTRLDRWFRANKAHNLKAPKCATTKAQVTKAGWLPSSERATLFEDIDGRELQTQLYSLEKWLGHRRNVVLVVWNEFQNPVIVKGPHKLVINVKSKPPGKKKYMWRIWLGDGRVANRAGFSRSLFVYHVKHQTDSDGTNSRPGVARESDSASPTTDLSTSSDRPNSALTTERKPVETFREVSPGVMRRSSSK